MRTCSGPRARRRRMSPGSRTRVHAPRCKALTRACGPTRTRPMTTPTRSTTCVHGQRRQRGSGCDAKRGRQRPSGSHATPRWGSEPCADSGPWALRADPGTAWVAAIGLRVNPGTPRWLSGVRTNPGAGSVVTPRAGGAAVKTEGREVEPASHRGRGPPCPRATRRGQVSAHRPHG